MQSFVASNEMPVVLGAESTGGGFDSWSGWVRLSAGDTSIRPAAKLAGDTMKRLGHYRAVVFWTALAPSGYPPVKEFGSFLKGCAARTNARAIT